MENDILTHKRIVFQRIQQQYLTNENQYVLDLKIDTSYLIFTRNDKNKFEGNLIVDGGKPNRYDIDSKHLADPFKLISFLNEIVYDYDIITNK